MTWKTNEKGGGRGRWKMQHGKKKKKKIIESKERFAVEMSLTDTENENKPCK